MNATTGAAVLNRSRRETSGAASVSFPSSLTHGQPAASRRTGQACPGRRKGRRGPAGAADALELGWSVFPEDRRLGYATETATALMDRARRTYGITRFISATTPDDAASLRVHEKLGFVRTGEVVDGELIFELRRAAP
ncbi:MAG: GNAT family N-acetyltransferase [Chloroflexi bacterium]|nr:GNAT family N-acetyltransferase [Chloroflexota bacterium]